MAITQAELSFLLKVTETVDVGVDELTNQPFVFEIAKSNSVFTLTPTTTVVGSQQWQDTFQLAAGTKTIDLTALEGGNLADKDFTGLAIRAFKFFCPATNTSFVTIADGDTNPYPTWGGSGGNVAVRAGGLVMYYFVSFGSTVSATVKNIKFTSSDTDATVHCQILAG